MESNLTRYNLIQMLSEEVQLGGWEWTVVFVILLTFLPLLPHRGLKFYTVYVSYVATTSVAAIIFIPLFALRSRNVVNLKISGIILKNLTRIFGIEWELRGGKILKEDRAAIITSNHQSILDVLGMFNIWEVMDKCTVVGKRELMYVQPFGIAAWLSGLIFIDRRNPTTANIYIDKAFGVLKKKKVSLRGLDQLNPSLSVNGVCLPLFWSTEKYLYDPYGCYIHDECTKLWVFPEGTRNGTGTLLPFKNGAFRVAIENQVPIIPVVFSPYYFIDFKNKTFDSGKVVISVLQPISTKGLGLDDISTIKEKTYNAMAVELEKLKSEISQYKKNKDMNKQNGALTLNR